MTQNIDLERENVKVRDFGPTQILGGVPDGTVVALPAAGAFLDSEFIVTTRVTRRVGLYWRYVRDVGAAGNVGARLRFTWRVEPVAGGAFPQSEEFFEPIFDLATLTEAAPFARTPSFFYELNLPVFTAAAPNGQSYISLERPPGMLELQVSAREAVDVANPGSMWILAAVADDL